MSKNFCGQLYNVHQNVAHSKKGISACRPGSMFIDIGADIGKFARKRHIKVIPELTGHGIGKYFHSKPDIFHVMNNYPGIMIPGMKTKWYTVSQYE